NNKENNKKNKKKERFKKEINFCKKNKHKNIVQIYANDEINGELCYVMPLYEMNFAELIKKGISLENGFNYIFNICNALEFLHNKNVIHRDLKPENILVNGEELVLADLGIAHFENSNITTKQDLLANRGYSAPEQKIKGLSKEITTAVDIFSLGLIINEIFTGKKPEGSNFTLVSDVYPWLIDIDELVERCMRQNPNERPTISDILFEIKYINNKLKIESNEIKEYLEDEFEELNLIQKCNNELKNKMIKQIIKDFLTAKYFLQFKSKEFLNEYYYNYNCNIKYKLDENLKIEYMKYLLKEECKNKFLYESNVYKNGKTYEPLNLNNNSEDKIIYKKFQSFLKKNFIVDGELLKLYSSCCNNHCEEILKELDNIQEKVSKLDCVAMHYIINHIISIIDINSDYDLLEYGILVNWEKTIFSEDIININKEQLIQPDQEYKEMDNILKKFNEKYNSIVTKKGDSFVVRFEDKKSYIAFKKYALELSKPYYIFEGDVLKLIRIEKEYEGIIELKQWDSFDVKNVLAKIMGLRKAN
uniref:protein kinase domain-containing protein n=1 Tax=Parvimonas micra TaxID=33033 RepID=UPI0004A7EA64